MRLRFSLADARALSLSGSGQFTARVAELSDRRQLTYEGDDRAAKAAAPGVIASRPAPVNNRSPLEWSHFTAGPGVLCYPSGCAARARHSQEVCR
jgi:hypothetical protein